MCVCVRIRRTGDDSSFRHSDDVICESSLQTLQHKRSFFRAINGLLFKYAHLCGVNWSDVVTMITFNHSLLLKCTRALAVPKMQELIDGCHDVIIHKMLGRYE